MASHSDSMGEVTQKTEAQADPPSQFTLIEDDNQSDNDGSDMELDAETRLQALTTTVKDQDELERQVAKEAEETLQAKNEQLDLKRIEKIKGEKKKLEEQKASLQERLIGKLPTTKRLGIFAQQQEIDKQVFSLNHDIFEIQDRIARRKANAERNNLAGQSGESFQDETRHEYLVRTGKITPFSKDGRLEFRRTADLKEALSYAEENDTEDEGDGRRDCSQPDIVASEMTHQNLRAPGFMSESRKSENESKVKKHEEQSLVKRTKTKGPDDSVEPPSKRQRLSGQDLASESEYEDDHSSDSHSEAPLQDLRDVDDGNEKLYQARLKDWREKRSEERNEQTRAVFRASDYDEEYVEEVIANNGDHGSWAQEWQLPHPTIPSFDLIQDLKVPGDIYPSLFPYQKTGVRWLAELYSQRTGGIVGDEMGLGKTIQVISFLATLHHSEKLDGPVLVVAPATVLKQWVNEFHRWWPPLRVSILHSSGSGMLNLEAEDDFERMPARGGSKSGPKSSKSHKQAAGIVNRVERRGHVLVTTYAGLQSYDDLLIPIPWQYVVLDEGHKIRNPNAAITLACKELRTVNRIILSGTPMQNNLTELWSLFDFVSPMRLGTLLHFRDQFEYPIKQGGYASATALQIRTAAKCAEILKDAISPYLLQRFKVDVAADLPKKVEQVLFCKLTKYQRSAYLKFLSSPDMNSILSGKRQMLWGVDILRKICNHPDLVDREVLSRKAGYDYGAAKKSGKMQVVKATLEMWKAGGHKTLLFCQTRIMLDIIQKSLVQIPGLKCRRMDGNTAIKDRQRLVDEFNTSPDLHVFLLTTKVGGLGVNLTGADRVLIFDPDWNPSTDMQARERAWRLGQKKEVQIYRLMTAGTIEEKIYHRQIFKQLLTNKVMRDPTQHQSFEHQDLNVLFSLAEEDRPTETGLLFNGNERTLEAVETPSKEAVPATQSASLLQLEGISSIEKFNDPAEREASSTTEGEPETKEKPAEGPGANSDKRIMDALFARSGVQSTLEHDRIVNGRRVIAPDTNVIEKEAKKVAAEAAQALKRAAAKALTVPIGTPTWTGTAGTAGRSEPGASTGRGISSSSVLERHQYGQNTGNSYIITNNNTSRGEFGSMGPRGKDFVKLIRDYLLAHGGAAISQMLVNHFNHMIHSDKQQMEFTSSLKEIATLSKSGNMRGKWTLKDEYK